MAKEIERKFLLSSEKWREEVIQEFDIQQGYILKGNDRAVRIRIKSGKAILNMKKGKSAIEREEFEYEIPLEDGMSLMKWCEQKILKTRYIVNRGDHVWEIDEFHGSNKGLVVAEIELDSVSQTFSLPDWIGLEVSEDPHYLNTYLSANPFSEW